MTMSGLDQTIPPLVNGYQGALARSPFTGGRSQIQPHSSGVSHQKTRSRGLYFASRWS